MTSNHVASDTIGQQHSAPSEQHLPDPLVRRWYVMKTRRPQDEAEIIQQTYNRGKQPSDNDWMEVFVPKMSAVRLAPSGRGRRTERSFFGNLLFLNARRDDIHHYKINRPDLRFYSTRLEGNSMVYLSVPERQMRDFMLIASVAEKETRYYTLEEGIFRKGDVVRIIGGLQVTEEGRQHPLDGVTGIVEKVGKNSVVVHVQIDGIGSVQTWTVSPQFIEYLQFADTKDTHSIAYEELERFSTRALTALRNHCLGAVEPTDRAACQIFLQRMQNARTVTSLMQQKLDTCLLVCALVMEDEALVQRFSAACLSAYPKLTAPQMRVMMASALFAATNQPNYATDAQSIVDSWAAAKAISPKQEKLRELVRTINNSYLPD